MKKIFLTHSSFDKPLIRKIRDTLLPFNNNIWIDELEILPGDSLYGKIFSGISESDICLAFISKDSVNSQWVEKELFAFMGREDSDNEIRIIPVLIDSTKLPLALNHKFYVRFETTKFAEGISNILKGIFRQPSVFVVSPNEKKSVELNSFIELIENFKEKGSEGNLFIVYDYYDFITNIIYSLKDDEFHQKDRLRIALPKCLDFISAITPSLIKAILIYFKNDAAAAPTAEQTIKLIWRLLNLVLFDNLKNLVDDKSLSDVNLNIYKAGIAEVLKLKAIESKYIPINTNLGILGLAWLEYLKTHMDNTYDIGFRGIVNKDGIKIYDAGHVRIPQQYIRKDSLTIFRDTKPDLEFLPYSWIRFILPNIVTKALVHYSFEGQKPADIIPHIGLMLKDYDYFGIE